ncbi:MAG: NAD(P)H-hydrate dehydratase, partial [Planctomycetota bacterium]
TGNSGMATGGTGDVLAGLIGAFIAQGLSAFDAACLGVHLHGLAGDLAAKRLGVWSLLAGDLAEELPNAFLDYEKRPAAVTS